MSAAHTIKPVGAAGFAAPTTMCDRTESLIELSDTSAPAAGGDSFSHIHHEHREPCAGGLPPASCGGRALLGCSQSTSYRPGGHCGGLGSSMQSSVGRRVSNGGPSLGSASLAAWEDLRQACTSVEGHMGDVPPKAPRTAVRARSFPEPEMLPFEQASGGAFAGDAVTAEWLDGVGALGALPPLPPPLRAHSAAALEGRRTDAFAEFETSSAGCISV